MHLDSQRWNRVVDAFSDALERTLPYQRERFLFDTLGDDPSLIAEVDAMLRAHEAPCQLWIEDRLLNDQDAPDLSGKLIGSYRLARLIATGGTGEVYTAEREGAPFRQQVALKILRRGIPGADARLRFRQERQILARLVHPLIVPLLDGGVTDQGQPFLVMQYVDGEPVTAFCERRDSGVEERLRLVRDIARRSIP